MELLLYPYAGRDRPGPDPLPGRKGNSFPSTP